uniref:Uncharacterized protein n=1 Tax=Knipowitschia caucasica TaxID=637954 RepID=A0AAV2JJN5_KNICA
MPLGPGAGWGRAGGRAGGCARTEAGSAVRVSPGWSHNGGLSQKALTLCFNMVEASAGLYEGTHAPCRRGGPHCSRRELL